LQFPINWSEKSEMAFKHKTPNADFLNGKLGLNRSNQQLLEKLAVVGLNSIIKETPNSIEFKNIVSM
jgi:hypothetical protein